MVRNSLLRQMATVLASFSLYTLANADTLVLQSGQKIDGQIIEHNELRVMVDVQGTPKTFFLGELASINGKPINVVPAKAAIGPAKKPVSAKANDEESSLIRFMAQRKPDAAPQVRPVDKKPSLPPTLPNVVSTTDGGIIVVSPGKITKYDKDLKVIKEIDL